jgi:hypothetical protein
VIEYIPNHVQQGLARLISQYQSATLFKTWLGIYLGVCQDIEDCLWEVLEKRNIDSGIGVQLDNIGKILNRPRGGLVDDDYRIALRCEIAILRSTGTADDIFTVGSLAIPLGFSFGLTDLGDAALLVTFNGVPTFNVLAFFQAINRARQGGVKLLFLFAPVANPFIWDTDVEFSDWISGGGGKLECVL